MNARSLSPEEEEQRIAATPNLAKRMGIWTRMSEVRARVDGEADLEIWEAPTTGDYTPRKWIIRPRPVRIIGAAEAGGEVIVVALAGEHDGVRWALVRWLGGLRKVACQGYVRAARLSVIRKGGHHGSSQT